MRSALRSASITAIPAAPYRSATGTLNSSTRSCEGWINGADFLTSPRLRGEVAALFARRVRGHRSHRIVSICGSESPSPQPSKSELRSSRPRKRGAREKRALPQSAPPLRIRRDRQERPLCDRRRQRRLLARLQRRGRELLDDQQQPRRTEIAQRGFDIALAREVQPRKAAVQQGR